MKNTLECRAPGQYDADKASLDAALGDFSPSLTIQSQAEETDINVIVNRFGITGEVPVSQRVPFHYDVDVDEVLDYRACMDKLNEAKRSFESLPAKVRAEFQNDPASFVDFATNPDNLPQLRAWGLAPPAPLPPSEPAPAPQGGG